MGKFDRGGRQFGGGRKFTEMHKATCSECGKICELPFRPTGDRPVFCSFCFDKQGGGDRPNRFEGERRNERPERPRFEDRQMHNAVCSKCGTDCQVPFRPMSGKEIFCGSCFEGAHREKTAFRPIQKDSGEVVSQIKMLNEKMDKLLKLLTPAETTMVKPLDSEVSPETLGETKTKKVKKEKKTATKKKK